MSFSPAQRHNQRMLMEKKLTNFESVGDGRSLHLQIPAIREDVENLRKIATIAERVAHKRDVLLPRWLTTAAEYLERGQVYPNPVFSYCIVWLFDVGEFEQALAWADIAIEQGQPTPKNIKSNFPTFVADTVMYWAEEVSARGESVAPYFLQVFKRVTTCWRLHEAITAKYFKFAGLYLLRDKEGRQRASAMDDIETLKNADALLASAEIYNRQVGVKTTRQQIAARIRQLEKQ